MRFHLFIQDRGTYKYKNIRCASLYIHCSRIKKKIDKHQYIVIDLYKLSHSVDVDAHETGDIDTWLLIYSSFCSALRLFKLLKSK